MISIPLTKGGQYFVSKAVIEGTGINYYQIFAIVELFVLIVIIFYCVSLKKKLLKNEGND